MEISEETIKRIAELSRLELKGDDIKQAQTDLQKILKAFAALSKIELPPELADDARSALALKSSAQKSEDSSRLQPDLDENTLASHTFLAQAPEREGVFVRVPAILSPST